jgi:hypothetical protein
MAAGELTARRVAVAVAVAGLLAGCGSRTIEGAGVAAPATRSTAGGSPSASGGTEVPIGPTGSGSPGGSGSPTGSSRPSGSGSPTGSGPAPPTTDGARPCPDAVARALPGAGPAELVAGYETSRFRLYYCRTADGTLYYRGVSKTDPKGVLTLPAHPVAGGYEAIRVANGSTFVYQVVSGALRVTQDGRLLRVDRVLGDL